MNESYLLYKCMCSGGTGLVSPRRSFFVCSRGNAHSAGTSELQSLASKPALSLLSSQQKSAPHPPHVFIVTTESCSEWKNTHIGQFDRWMSKAGSGQNNSKSNIILTFVFWIILNTCSGSSEHYYFRTHVNISLRGEELSTHQQEVYILVIQCDTNAGEHRAQVSGLLRFLCKPRHPFFLNACGKCGS